MRTTLRPQPALMEQSKDGLNRVSEIVRSLKEFSRVDSRQQWQRVDLHRGIDSTLTIIAAEIGKVADVSKHYAPLPEVDCMPSALNQVVMNLLINAAHAIGPQRGRISISTGADEECAWIEVGDNGCGIADEVLPSIFDPFFTTKPIGKGTGLGLSLSYGIVQSHQGNIEVRTKLGQGTAFRVTLPLRQRRQQVANAA